MGTITNLDEYRLAQAAALLKLFRKAHGREAANIAELQAWVAAQAPGRVDRLAVLADEEIAKTVRGTPRPGRRE